MKFETLTWLENGELDRTATVQSSSLDATVVDYFMNDLNDLSCDLELPMEKPLPGVVEHGEYRVASDLKGGAFVLFYYHDELVMASLMLQGINALQETDLLQVFKYLLLEPEDVDEEDGPTDEEIDEILDHDAFDFEGSTSTRPVLFNVVYELEPDAPDAVKAIEEMSHHIAVAFFSSPAQVVADEQD